MLAPSGVEFLKMPPKLFSLDLQMREDTH